MTPSTRRLFVVMPVCAVAMLAGAVPAVAAPKVSVSPKEVRAGAAVTVTGSGFGARRTVKVSIGPAQSEVVGVLGTARTDRNGRFKLRRSLARGAEAGRYVVVACGGSTCSRRATAGFRITAAGSGSSCGTLTANNGETLRVLARGTTCSAGLRVMRAYYARAKQEGACKTSMCLLTIEGYSCGTRALGETQETGIVSTCLRDGGRRIETRTR